DRIEDLARAMRQAGDPRTLAQLRADLAAEALLRHGYGPCPTHAHPPNDAPRVDGHDDDPHHGGRGADHDDDAADGVDGDVDGHSDHDDDVDGDVDGDVWGEQGPGCGCAPAVPPATAWIVVPFEVATGASNAACELPGYGWVTAEHARQVITAPGSVWRWLAVDHRTGRALQLGTDRYRPTPAMIEQVRAIDGHCRGPGCQTPARRCDLDHHVPYPNGPTTVANLGPLHRHHHNLKTAGLWECTPLPAPDTALAARDRRGLAWRTLTGREYVTYPKSWTEALHDPDAPEHTPPTRRANTARQEHRDREASDEYWNERCGWNDPPPF
ncbi:MAG TPA: HNH endonuclease signature motif containing protein, partial [Intrasporangium sp.]|nr:HNH endonuclease signature motif containing protein [Intrasporangium sp.]